MLATDAVKVVILILAVNYWKPVSSVAGTLARLLLLLLLLHGTAAQRAQRGRTRR